MPTLASIDGRTLTPNLVPIMQNIGSILERDRVRAELENREDLLRAEDFAREDALRAQSIARAQAADRAKQARAQADEDELNALIKALTAGNLPQEVDAAEGRARVDELLASPIKGPKSAGQKALSRLQQINPSVAQETLNIIGSGNPQSADQLRALSRSGVELGDAILKASDLANKKKIITQFGSEATLKGQSPDRFIELLNMGEDELNLEAKRLQIAGRDVDFLLQPNVSPKSFLDTSQGRASFVKLATKNPTAAKQILEMQELRAKQNGSGGAGSFSKAPGVIVKTGQETYAQSIPVMNQQTGQIENVMVPIEGQPVSRLGETGEETSLRRIEEASSIASRTTREKGQETRVQGQIDAGLVAADALPVINRSIELLDRVRTGGLEAASLAARQFLGVEGADEAELSANLGKTVLSQLRSTFGAAFTEREGARLANIEAGFGKSTAGNKRLLNQTRRIVKRAADRGVKLALQNGDTISADEIRDAMQFSLSVPEGETVSEAGASVGKVLTATNPETGERLIFKDGQWIPVEPQNPSIRSDNLVEVPREAPQWPPALTRPSSHPLYR